MLPRFVLVPAVPVEKPSYRDGLEPHSEAYSGSFDIYDNKEEVRLTRGFHDRTVAEAACVNMNCEADNPDGCSLVEV